MSSKRILYGNHISPPVRAVHMTLEALELDYEFKPIDLAAGEHKTPEFLKKNPQHTVPTLEEEDGKCIWESHAIMAYLVRRYGKDDSLYPKDFYQRAVVDQRLHYENSALFTNLGQHTMKPLKTGEITKEKIPEMLQSISEAYEMLETFMGDNDFIAGKNLTIADLSIVSILSSVASFAPIETEKFPKLEAWFGRMQKLPYYELVNGEGLQMLKEKFLDNLNKLT